MAACGDRDFTTDLDDPCVRRVWEAAVPAFFVLISLAAVVIPWTELLLRYSAPFTPFLSLKDAEAYQPEHHSCEAIKPAPLRRSFSLSSVALLETVAWTVVGGYHLTAGDELAWKVWTPFVIAFSWLYGTIRPLSRRRTTPPYDLFTLYLLHLASGLLEIGATLYDRASHSPPESHLSTVATILNLTAILAALGIVLLMPVGQPSPRVDKSEIGVSISPEDYTTLWRWMTFSWVNPLIEKGTNQPLDEKDVWNLSPIMQSRSLFFRFSEIQRSTLFRCLLAANALDLFGDFSLTLVSVFLNYASPFFLNLILTSIAEGTPSARSKGYIYAFLAFLCNIIQAESDLQHLWLARRASARIRSTLMASVYDKALKRKDSSGVVSGKTVHHKEKAGLGKIVQLMSADTDRCAMAVSMGHIIYGFPLAVVIACTSLYRLLSVSAFAGFLTLIFMIPLNHFLSTRNVAINKELATARDKRMSVLNELISEAKFLKLLAWEERWMERVMDARKAELRVLKKDRINSVMFFTLWVLAPITVSVVAFGVFVIRGNELTVPIAFTSITLFNMIKLPLNSIPFWIIELLQAGVALGRISAFLNEEEVPDYVSSLKQNPTSVDTHAGQTIGVARGAFKWSAAHNDTGKGSPAAGKRGKSPAVTEVSAPVPEETDSRDFELLDISVLFPVGKLTLITGPTASGKTALLMALLGEMNLTNPDAVVHLPKNVTQIDEFGLRNSLSYVAQTPWLEHLSIKDNILFGSSLEEDRYAKVLECCALSPDLAMLEDGDLTEVGARGISLSGGQKARVALARAVYARTKHILLDDPLSAVDIHTARFLFERLFQGPLLKNRTVVLVTHHVELVLPIAYYIVRMLDGRIDTQGTVQKLRDRGVLDTIALDGHDHETKPHFQAMAAPIVDGEAEKRDEKKKPRKFIEDEARAIGGVKWSIYKVYLQASSYITWTLVVLGILAAQGNIIIEKLWIQIWGESYDRADLNMAQASYMHSTAFLQTEYNQAILGYSFPPIMNSSSVAVTAILPTLNLPSARYHPLFYVGVYATIGLVAGVITILQAIVQYIGSFRASKILFNRLLRSVVRSTMRWHDVTPTGRILNRFSKDIETVDSSLSGSIRSTSIQMANFVTSVLMITIIYPGFLLPAMFIGYAYVKLSIGYINSGRDLRRMESTSRSPIFSGFSETLAGIITVRAFSAEQRFSDNLHKQIDFMTNMWYSFWILNRWLSFRFDCLGAASILITSLLAVSGLIPYDLAGLAITSAMGFTGAAYWTCRQITTLEMDLNSVERVVEYLDLPQEPPAVIESNRPPAYWPSNDTPSFIEVENLVIQYAPELPPVVHDVSFSIRPGEKIGLLGRTGSGKSTLAMAFLRFVEPTQGSITIDGVNISSIGLHDLRSHVTIIPQDSVLFSGTIRDNLDPFQEHTDEECNNALFRVQLISKSAQASRRSSGAQSRASSSRTSLSEGDESDAATPADDSKSITLQTEVSVGGGNFSQGQRQLLAMARALLRKTPIAIFDEATSSIDFETDAKIQVTIREEFKNSCILTVAHRIRTVIDYDRLLVLDKGRVSELDTPYNLIQKEGGIFREMCLKSGTFKELEEAARMAMGTKQN